VAQKFPISKKHSPLRGECFLGKYNGFNIQYVLSTAASRPWTKQKMNAQGQHLFTIDSVWFGPYGRAEILANVREIAASMFLSFVCVVFLGLCVPDNLSLAAAVGGGIDSVSCALLNGGMAGIGTYFVQSFNPVGRLPNAFSPGQATVHMLTGRIGALVGVMYIVVGLVGSFVAGVLFCIMKGRAAPVPLPQDPLPTFLVQMLFNAGVACMTAKDDPPVLSGVAAFVMTTGAHLRWKMWTFNSYIYLAAAYTHILTDPAAFGRVLLLTVLYADIAGWVLALIWDVLVFRVFKMKRV
jgi:hypothetical protein